jgi:DNA-binding transcriptional LysR family regulator
MDDRALVSERQLLQNVKFKQNLTIRHMRLISVLGRELSVSRCARVLNTSQSAISRGLSDIEDTLGVQLFERTTRRVGPTKYGRILIWHSEQILGQLDRAEAEFGALSQGKGIAIDVGVIGAFSPDILVQAIKLANAQEPSLRVHLHSNFAQWLIPELMNGRFNLALTHLDTSDFGNQELVIHPLYEDRVGVVVGLDHPLARSKRVSWHDLVDEQWVLSPLETSTRRVVERKLIVYPESKRRVVVETIEMHYRIALVRNAGMLTAFPLSLARWFAEDLGAVKLLPIVDRSSQWTACVAHRRSKSLSAAEAMFINCLKATSTELIEPSTKKRKAVGSRPFSRDGSPGSAKI